jgi:hypothetical protein
MLCFQEVKSMQNHIQGDRNEPGGKTLCKELRLALIVGSPSDNSLDAAARFVIERAKALGGNFRIWQSLSTRSPLRRITDIDVTNGRLGPDPVEHDTDSFDDLISDCQDCRGRISELIIFHHGSPVDEAVLAHRLRRLMQRLRIPVCRVVWWACNAETSLDVGEGGWADSLMKALGGIARCKPCGCGTPIELVWPTAGRCYLVPRGATFEPRSGDGKVNRARWGYPQPGGGIGPRPDPADPQPTRNPPDREPPHGQEPERVSGHVLGLEVKRYDD